MVVDLSGGMHMKDKFISFLRKNRAWEEFKHELYAQNKLGDLNNALTDVFEYIEHRDITKDVLANGSFFFWNKSRCKTDWEALSSEWAKYVSNMDVDETELPHNMMVNSRDLGDGKYEVSGVIFYADSHACAIRKYRRSENEKLQR